MQAMGMEKGEAIEARIVTNSIEKAQRKVEGRNFDYRKQLLEYDDVANDQRRVIYSQRNELLEAEEITDAIAGIRDEVIDNQISLFIPPQSVEEQWDITGLEKHFYQEYNAGLDIQKWLDEDDKLYEDTLREKITTELNNIYTDKETRFGGVIRTIEKQIMLQVLDQLWKEHLQNMDHLRQGINLRAYAQRNPKQEYKRESFELFQKLLEDLKAEVTQILFRIEPISQERADEMERARLEEAERQKQQLKMRHDQVSALSSEAEPAPAPEESKPERPFVRAGKKVGRNDPCTCGSGKKYKACCGRLS